MVRRIVRKVNGFYRTVDARLIEETENGLIISDRQRQIMNMYYHRRHDVGFIADYLSISQRTVSRELASIRVKLAANIRD